MAASAATIKAGDRFTYTPTKLSGATPTDFSKCANWFARRSNSAYVICSEPLAIAIAFGQFAACWATRAGTNCRPATEDSSRNDMLSLIQKLGVPTCSTPHPILSELPESFAAESPGPAIATTCRYIANPTPSTAQTELSCGHSPATNT